MSEEKTVDSETIVFAGTISPVLLAVREKLKEEPKYHLLEEAKPRLLADFVRSVSPSLVLLHVVDTDQLAENVTMVKLLGDLIKARTVRVVLISGKIPDKAIGLFEKAGVLDVVPDSTPTKNIIFKISKLSAALALSKQQNQQFGIKKILGNSELTGPEMKMKEWVLLKPRDVLPFAVAASELLSQSEMDLEEIWNKMVQLLGSILGSFQMEIWFSHSKKRTFHFGEVTGKQPVPLIETWDSSWTAVKTTDHYVVIPLNEEGTGMILYGEMAVKLPLPFSQALIQAFEGLILSESGL